MMPTTARSLALGVLAAMLVGSTATEAAPVAVRFPEGLTRGFLVLRSADGAAIAHGELTQKPTGATLVSRLLLNFKDGSVFDETLTFSQRQVFRLESYRLKQRGPSFPTADVSVDRKTGQYRARTADKPGGEEKQAGGRVEMPADLYNGLILTVAKNLPARSAGTVQMMAFTPEPLVVKVTIGREGEDRVRVGPEAKAVTRYLVTFDIGGLKGAIASLIGKAPPDIRYWIVNGDIPAFARFEGAMFLNGPVWRLEQAPLTWGK